MIKDGKAFTPKDENYLEDLPQATQDIVCHWINNNFTPRKTPLYSSTSYGLKHILNSNIGIYLTNNQYKDAMLRCGYKPVDAEQLNWNYCISKRSPVFQLWRWRK